MTLASPPFRSATRWLVPLGAALALHFCAAEWLAGLRTTASVPARRTAIAVETRAAPGARPPGDALQPTSPQNQRSLAAADRHRAPPANPTPKPAPARPANTVDTVDAPLARVAAAPGPQPQPTPATPTRFYTYAEVEIPAAPADDWQLDAATLDGARIARLVFELFVDHAGQVVDCTIVEPADLDATLRASIVERLKTTLLRPAILTGRPVDSVRRIEFTVSQAMPTHPLLT